MWKDNRGRMYVRISTWKLLTRRAQDYKVVLVGDATMVSYKITHAGGSVEHWNSEPGTFWMSRFMES